MTPHAPLLCAEESPEATVHFEVARLYAEVVLLPEARPEVGAADLTAQQVYAIIRLHCIALVQLITYALHVPHAMDAGHLERWRAEYTRRYCARIHRMVVF